MTPTFASFFPEVHLEIIRRACTDSDGGATARSLSLVSKSFHTLTKPFLLYSITVCGLTQIHAFIEHLDENPEVHSTIKHLFLSERTQAGGETIDPEWEVMMLLEAVTQIFPIVGPSLETLTYLCRGDESRERIHALLGHHFPRLRELTIKGDTNIRFFIPFPVLERLHMYSDSLDLPDVHHPIGDLHAKCPNLTHLKVSGFAADGLAFILALRHCWATIVEPEETWGTSWDMLDGGSGLPSGLRQVILQPSNPSGNRCGHPTFEYWRMIKRIQAFAESNANRGIVFGGCVGKNMHHEQAKQDWSDRLGGKKGGWATEVEALS